MTNSIRLFILDLYVIILFLFNLFYECCYVLWCCVYSISFKFILKHIFKPTLAGIEQQYSWYVDRYWASINKNYFTILIELLLSTMHYHRPGNGMAYKILEIWKIYWWIKQIAFGHTNYNCSHHMKDSC